MVTLVRWGGHWGQMGGGDGGFLSEAAREAVVTNAGQSQQLASQRSNRVTEESWMKEVLRKTGRVQGDHSDGAGPGATRNKPPASAAEKTLALREGGVGSTTAEE